ncbi:MAG: DUF4870 domain-containing protein [Acidimicrobiales bacterium]
MSLGNEDYGTAGNPAAPAGWYPVDGGMQRYWDGRQWTEHMAPAPGPAAAPSPPDPGPAAGDAPTPWVDGSPVGQPPAGHTPPGPSAPGPFSPEQSVEPQPVSWSAPGQVPAGSPVMPGAVTADDRSMGLLLHLLALVAGFLGPLIVWWIKKDQSPFIDYHGKEALNFQISLFVYWIGALFAMLILVGFLLIPVLLVLQILFPILAGIAANRGEYYRYPLTIRFIS